MITLIDNTGYPTAISTTGTHSMKQCEDTLNEFNDKMQLLGSSRPYVEAINQDGDKFVLNIVEIIGKPAAPGRTNPFLDGFYYGTVTTTNMV